jgi:ribosomal protein S4E
MNIKVIIKEIKEETTVLKFEDGNNISWPTNKLPKEIKVGDALNIAINDNGKTAEPEQLAKDLLNEILNIE